MLAPAPLSVGVCVEHLKVDSGARRTQNEKAAQHLWDSVSGAGGSIQRVLFFKLESMASAWVLEVG